VTSSWSFICQVIKDFDSKIKGCGESPSWFRKTLGFGPSCTRDEKGNKNSNQDSVEKIVQCSS